MRKFNPKYLLTAGFLLAADIGTARHHGVGEAVKLFVHGMLVFDKEKYYALYLLLFHTLHNYQVIFYENGFTVPGLN